MAVGDSPSVYRAICESMACGVMLIDAQGRIETFNLAAAAILGLERKAVTRLPRGRTRGQVRHQAGVTGYAHDAVSTGSRSLAVPRSCWW